MSRTLPIVAAALAACLALAAPAAARRGEPKPKPTHGAARLTNTGVDANAAGRTDAAYFPAVGTRAERSRVRMFLRHLDRRADYTLWMDDPSTDGDETLVDTTIVITTKGGGNAKLNLDTKRADTLPFGAALADLSGKAFEIRDGTGAAVLTGAVPTLR